VVVVVVVVKIVTMSKAGILQWTEFSLLLVSISGMKILS